MIRPLALLVCMGTSAAAQAIDLPPALAPCRDRHLDAGQYREDLAALGWTFVPALNRAAQVVAIADTFVASVAGRDGPRDARVEASRNRIASLAESTLVFVGDGGAATLFVGGGPQQGGGAVLRCWAAFDDATLFDNLFESLLSEAEAPDPAEDEQYVFLTLPPDTEGVSLRLSNNRPTPGRDGPVTRTGLTTVLSLAPEAIE